MSADHFPERDVPEADAPMFYTFPNEDSGLRHVIGNAPRQATLEWPENENWYAVAFCGGFKRQVPPEKVEVVRLADLTPDDHCTRCVETIPPWHLLHQPSDN